MDNLEKLKLRIANETLGKEMNTEMNADNYERVLDDKKLEVAAELGLKEKIQTVGWKNMTSGEAGKIGGQVGGHIGGQMVKKLIEMAESQMAPVDNSTIEDAKKHLESNK